MLLIRVKYWKEDVEQCQEEEGTRGRKMLAERYVDAGRSYLPGE